MLLSESTVARKLSEAARTTEAIDVALGHPLELNDKPLVLKTSHAQGTRHREYKLALT